MKLFLRGLILAIAALAITACSNNGKNSIRSIEGTAYYLQRIALPTNAVLEVSLNDITASNGSIVTLDTQQFKTEGKQVPLAFTYKVPENINTKKKYALSAIIRGDTGETIFVTKDTHPVLTDENKTSTVNIQLVSNNT